MELSIIQTLLLSLFISFMAVETYWWGGAIYIARPVFAGPLIGLIMGDLKTGLLVGGSVEMMFLGGLAMGAYSPPNAYIGGMVGTAMAILSGGNMEVGIALAYPIGVLVQMLNYLVTQINIIWVTKAEKAIEQDKRKEFEFYHYMSIITRMLIQFFLPTFIALLIGSTSLESFYNNIPLWVNGGLKVAAGILPAIGMASIISTLGIRKGWPYFLVGFVLATYLGMDIMSIALLSLGLAVIIIMQNKEGVGDLRFDKNDANKGCLTNKEFKKVFFRSFTSMGSFNYKGYNNIGYVYSIEPALRKIYEGNENGYHEAMVRNCEFFNCHPYFSNLIMGASLALEEENAKNHDDNGGVAITSTKAALMGPLAGIGDSVFQGTYRTIFSAIGASLTIQGNIAGPFIYLIPQLILAYGTRWFFLKYAYEYGVTLVAKLQSSNLFDRFVEGANIVGMMVIAAMTSSFVSINLTPVWEFGSKTVSLQGVFDAILPNLLPLLCVLFFYKLMTKNKKGIYICLILAFVVGFVGAYFGFM